MKIDKNIKLIINGLEIPMKNLEDANIEFNVEGRSTYNKYTIEAVAESGSEADVNLRKLVNKIGK